MGKTREMESVILIQNSTSNLQELDFGFDIQTTQYA